MLEIIEQLAEECNIHVLKHGALQLIRREDCDKVLEVCKSSKVLILGIEAFSSVGDKIIPKDDLIADFSELASKQWDIACVESVKSAEFYFKNINKQENLWFDFTLTNVN